MSTVLSDVIRNGVNEIWNQFPALSKLWFKFDNIPPEKLANAISSYAPIDKDEGIVLLCDSTTFGSAKNGTVLTTKRAYSKGGYFGNNILDIDVCKNELENSFRDSPDILILPHIVGLIKMIDFLQSIKQKHAEIDTSNTDQPAEVLCPNCGTELETGEKFCGGCGTAVITMQQPQGKQASAMMVNQELENNILMIIDDVFTISGRGTIVTGQLKNSLKKNESVEIVGNGKKITTIVTGIESFNKLINEAFEGDNVGLLLRGIAQKQIERGFYIQKEQDVQGIISKTNTTSVPGDQKEKTAQNICANCGTELETGEKFCGSCGSTIPAGQPSMMHEPPGGSSVNTETPGKPCINCGKTLDPDWQVCPFCKTETGSPLCSGCGKTLEPGWTICPYCKAEV